ncbi:MAG: hypothetical protein CV087_20235 [Candidatus Brocadia sp. WS118]|nr:MAG: hypothetical protein CV087_20235 [Candidatus Brocadia sp. WS118]
MADKAGSDANFFLTGDFAVFFVIFFDFFGGFIAHAHVHDLVQKLLKGIGAGAVDFLEKVVIGFVGFGVFIHGVVALGAVFPEIVGGAVDADFVAGDADGHGFFEQFEQGFAPGGGEF